jgi:carbonic anhydrase/acetyltransferase-like protein (isoleucine patch superfamily)
MTPGFLPGWLGSAQATSRLRLDVPMAIYALGDLTPSIDSSAFVHPDAVIIGDVTIGPRASIWPCAVLRADSAPISIGQETSVQDGVVIHVAHELPTLIGARVTLGHVCHVEGAVIDDEALIGVNSVVLHRAHVGRGAVVGAGAVVTADTVVPPLAMALGVPATIKLNAVEPGFTKWNISMYVHNAARYPKDLRRLD